MLITVDVQEPSLPVEQSYEGRWASEAQAKQSGIANVWLPIRDINGLSEAITALFRVENRHSDVLSPAEREQRVAILQLARRILTAERELLLKEFAILLGNALSQTSEPKP